MGVNEAWDTPDLFKSIICGKTHKVIVFKQNGNTRKLLGEIRQKYYNIYITRCENKLSYWKYEMVSYVTKSGMTCGE